MLMRFITMSMLMLLSFGCQCPSKENKASIVRLNIKEEPQSLDPRRVRALSSLTLVNMLFDGLMRIGKEGKSEFAVAESVNISSDLKTYTFRLKKTFWTHGDPVKPSDFAYAWKKRLSPDFPSDTAEALYVIRNAKAAKEGRVSLDEVGIRVQGERELVVELEKPTSYFLDLVAHPSWAPISERVDEENPSWMFNAESYVCNGPFYLSSWKHQEQLILNKNPTYWDAESVHLSSLQFQMLAEETELKMFENKELDWAGSPLSTLPLDALKELKYSGALKTKTGLGTDFIRVNVEVPPLSHVALRRALGLSMNRQELVEHVMQGGQLAATGLVPSCLELQKSAYFEDANTEEAKRLFEKALSELKLTRETFPELTYLYRSSERNHLVAQAIQQQWEKSLGIRVKLEAVEGKVFFSRISKQDYQLAYGNWFGDFSDPINFLEVFKSGRGGSNNTHWENSRYAELLTLSSELAAGKERQALLGEAEKILIEEMPIIPISYMSMVYVTQPYLKDVVLSSMGQIDFKWASIEKIK